ncbi:MAG TPA: AMIN domain-containing protein [Gammaproteobacteria bacterium]|nr:AMIN domain-containing protein [Gammaproteobacteria bacterium]
MRYFAGLIIMLLAQPVLAGSVTVKQARLWAAPDHTRVVFDIDGSVQHSLFTLRNPDRIVIDLRNTRMPKQLTGPEYSKGLVKRIRSAVRNQKDLRVVLDLSGRVKPKSFVLKPGKNYGHRLVLDLYQSGKKKKAVLTAKQQERKGQRDLIIAIDAGHGGEDPGATGTNGTHEKDAVFAIAKKLKQQINRAYGMRAYMIRKGDYYISLRQRTRLARRIHADMYISIHADAFRDKRAHGSSVYALSRRGASNEAARWLAEKENASDHIGGVSLDDKDGLLAAVLLDLSLNGTIEASVELSRYVLRELRKVGHVHKPRPQQAGFVVLKSPDIPSILIETAFISNPREERNLRSSRHQKKVARAIFNGVQRYFKKNIVPGTRLAGRRYTIARGDTLSDIAARYQVSLIILKRYNSLNSNRLKVGQILRIPQSSDS